MLKMQASMRLSRFSARELDRKALRLRKLKLGPEHPDTGTTLYCLAITYHEHGDLPRAAAAFRELLSLHRQRDPQGAYAAGTLSLLGAVYVDQQRPVEAEALLRESVALTSQKLPNSWWHFNGQSILGASLLGQKKYAEAEPLLLAGYEGLKKHEGSIPSEARGNLERAIRRLVELYEALGHKDKADHWRIIQASATSATSPPIKAAPH
jgi:tetratricopeptide (TPR) repeat protein